MAKTDKHAQFLRDQFELSKKHIDYWNAMVISGAYKNRLIYKREGGAECLLTEEENLTDAMAIMRTHIQRLAELADQLAE